MRIIYRVTIVLFALVALGSLVRSVIHVRAMIAYDRGELSDELRDIGEALLANVESGDEVALQELRMARAVSFKHSVISYSFVELEGNDPVGGTGLTLDELMERGEDLEITRDRDTRTGRIELYLPVRTDQISGALVIVRDTTVEQSHVRRVLFLEVVSNAFLIALFSLAAWMLNRNLQKPFDQIISHALNIGAGKYDPVEVTRRDEFGRVEHVLNEVGRRIEAASVRIRSERKARVHVEKEVEELSDAVDEMASELEDAWVEAAEEHEERLKLESQLAHADRLATVGRLASALIHDIGTPLNVISGRAQLIEKDSDEDSAAAKDSRIIQQQTQTIAQMIRRVLDFARREPVEMAPDDVAQIARDACLFLKPLADKKNVELQGPPPGVEAIAYVDSMGVEQVLTNLIGNAIGACSASDQIVVTVEPDGDDVAVVVRDTGPGIPESVRDRIFEPFFTTKPSGQGTGLGLGVVKNIVDHHRGSIELDTDGTGTTFTVRLPRS